MIKEEADEAGDLFRIFLSCSPNPFRQNQTTEPILPNPTPFILSC